jgi:transposase
VQLEPTLTRKSKDGPMPTTATVEIQVDVPAGITIDEYERIENGHSFHVSWELPDVCRCETCKRETPLVRIDKAKFLAIRDLELWGQPSFFVYREVQHRCPCGHRQSLLAPFKRRDVKYTYRFEEYVITSLIGSTAEEVAQRLGIAAETVERIVRNRIEDSKAKKIDPARLVERVGLDEISLRKGHKGYATILTDLTNPAKAEILAVAKGRDEAAAQECLEKLSAEQRLAVRFHHTDMGAAFLKAGAVLLPKSESVIDRFHVAKKLGEVADALRKKTTEPIDGACPESNASVYAP